MIKPKDSNKYLNNKIINLIPFKNKLLTSRREPLKNNFKLALKFSLGSFKPKNNFSKVEVLPSKP